MICLSNDLPSSEYAGPGPSTALLSSVVFVPSSDSAFENRVVSSTLDPYPRSKQTKIAIMTDWSKLKVKELKDELESRGLDSSGKKAELIERLEAAAPSSAAPETADAPESAAPEVADKDTKMDEDVKDEDVKDEDHEEHASPRELSEDEGDGDAGNKRQRTIEDGHAKKTRKLCRTILVTGFKAPVVEEDVRALMETHGKVDKMWVSDEKKEAMVFFQDSDGATAARKALDEFAWPDGEDAGSLKSSYRNIHAAIKYVRRSGDEGFSVELTDEDPTDDRKGDKDAERKAPNPFRKTTTEPMLYWKTVRAYP